MVAVVGNTGIPLAPTSEYRARKLLKSKRAKVYRHGPYFAIQVLDRECGESLDSEYGSDAGYQHAGISIKSDIHEYISEQRNMLEGEAERNRERVKKRPKHRSPAQEYQKVRRNDRKKRKVLRCRLYRPPYRRESERQ